MIVGHAKRIHSSRSVASKMSFLGVVVRLRDTGTRCSRSGGAVHGDVGDSRSLTGSLINLKSKVFGVEMLGMIVQMGLL